LVSSVNISLVRFVLQRFTWLKRESSLPVKEIAIDLLAPFLWLRNIFIRFVFLLQGCAQLCKMVLNEPKRGAIVVSEILLPGCLDLSI